MVVQTSNLNIVKNQLSELMAKAREVDGLPISHNQINHLSRKYGLSFQEIYNIMYDISSELPENKLTFSV